MPSPGPGHVVGRREDPQRVDLADHVAGQRVQVVQRLHLVAEELDAHREPLVGRDDLDGVARTRNEPRVKARSLRVYCTSTSSRSNASRGISSPTFSSTERSIYDCWVPRP